MRESRLKRRIYFQISEIVTFFTHREKELGNYAFVGAMKVLCRNAAQISFMWCAISWLTAGMASYQLYVVMLAFVLSAMIYAYTALTMPKISSWVYEYANTASQPRAQVRKSISIWQLFYLVVFWLVLLSIIAWQAALCCLLAVLVFFLALSKIRLTAGLFRIITSPILVTILLFFLYSATLSFSVGSVENVILFVVFLCLRQFSGSLAGLIRVVGMMMAKEVS